MLYVIYYVIYPFSSRWAVDIFVLTGLQMPLTDTRHFGECMPENNRPQSHKFIDADRTSETFLGICFLSFFQLLTFLCTLNKTP